MLSRLADNLYWMSRYIERAENTARMLDAQHQASMLPGGAARALSQWEALLRRSELVSTYQSRHRDLTAQQILDFMVSDPDNPSSIFSCVQAARDNAKAVRVVLAPELWESVNSTWIEMRSLLRIPFWHRDPNKLFEWVKYHSHLFRGAMIGTMLQDEAYLFSRMGTFVERADNTARILDVKYVARETALPDTSGGADYYFWASVLRSVSAFEIYRKVYRDMITPMRIAELLIQRKDMPRSLFACMNEVVVTLEEVADARSSEALRMAGRLRAQIQYLRVDESFEPNIHSFLSDFLRQINEMASRISDEFLVPLVH